MYDLDILHYLQEFKRILKPDGLAYLTCFVISDPVLASARATDLTKFHLKFETEISKGCFINDTEFPLGAIGYSQERWKQIVEESGLKFKVDFLKGAWSGYHSDPVDGQDALVLCR